MSTDLEDMAEKAQQLADRFVARRTFDEARAALNEAGMNRARQRLVDALGNIAIQQGLVREQAEVVGQLRDAYDQALFAAEWALDARFVAEGNKVFLVTQLRDGVDERRPMTADERARWKTVEARQDPGVVAAGRALRDAESAYAATKDAVGVAEKAFSAARADLDAAIATVGILAASIKGEPR